MKVKSLFFAALMIVSASLAVAGKDEPHTTGMAVVPVKGSDVFKVVYKGNSTGRVKLNIYDQESHLILTQTFSSTEGFICPLNFAGLAEGNYTVEIVDNNGKKVEKISFAKPRKTVTPKHVHVSKLATEDNKFLLSVSGPSAGEKISVSIFDRNNTLLHTETRKVEGDFAQVYNVQTGSGAYTFEVSDRNGKIKTIRF